MVRVRKVQPLEGFKVSLEFTDGTVKTVDLEPYLHGPIFEPIRQDQSRFRSVRVDEELGTIIWEGGADIDPDVLRWDRVPAEPEGASN